MDEIKDALEKVGISNNNVEVNDTSILINENVETDKLVYLKFRLRFPIFVGKDILYDFGHNWANVSDENQVTEIPWEDNWVYKDQ